MTTIPTTRPTIPGAPQAARPSAPGAHSPASVLPTIDPLKLLKKHKWTLLATALIGAVLGTIVHFVLLFTFPIYTAFVVYECTPVTSQPADLTPSGDFKNEIEKFMATQVQIMQSDGIVAATLQDPDLKNWAPKWYEAHTSHGALDPDWAARALKRGIGAGVMGDSSLIRLSFWGTDPDEATGIVRILSRTYIKFRQRASSLAFSDKQDLLQQQVTQTQDAIAKLQARRTSLMQEQGADSLESQSSSILANIRDMQEKLNDTRVNREALVSRRDSMEAELRNGQTLTYSGDIRQRVEEDPNYMHIKDDVNKMDADLSAARMRLGPDHPDIRRRETMLDGLRRNQNEVKERLLRQYFDAQLDTIRNGISSLGASEADLLKKLEDARAKAAELNRMVATVHDIDDQIKQLNTSMTKFSDDLKTVNVMTASGSQTRVAAIQDAQPPKTVTFPKIYIMIPMGILLALGLVGGVIVFLEVIDTRVKGASDVAMIPRTRILGLVPHAAEDPDNPEKVETVFRDRPAGVVAEAYRQIRGTLLKKMKHDGLKTLLVMSGMPGSGSTTVACNLAFAMASADLKVLLIDANFRRPAVHRVLGLAETPGLADVLAGSTTLNDAAKQTENPRVHVLPAGTPSQRIVERLSTEPMGELLRQAGAGYDVVLIDVAPAQIAGDAIGLANRCDATMLVVRAFAEKRGMVARLRNELGETRGEFLGVVINAVRSLAGGYLKGNILAAHKYQNGKAGSPR